MITGRSHRFVDERVGMCTAILPAFVTCSGDKMPQVFHDDGRQEAVSVVIEIQSPRIDSPVGNDFKRVPDRMLARDRATQLDPLFSRSIRTADQ